MARTVLQCILGRRANLEVYGWRAHAPTNNPHHNINTLRSRQNGRHFSDDILKCIFFYENICISTKFSLKFVAKSSINNIPALVQLMAWCRPGDESLSETMMVSLLTHICVTRSQWAKFIYSLHNSFISLIHKLRFHKSWRNFGWINWLNLLSKFHSQLWSAIFQLAHHNFSICYTVQYYCSISFASINVS